MPKLKARRQPKIAKNACCFRAKSGFGEVNDRQRLGKKLQKAEDWRWLYKKQQPRIATMAQESSWRELRLRLAQK